MSKGRKEHHEEHVDETWLIPYADLLTLLLALFIILFASSNMDAHKYDSLMKSLSAAFNGGTGSFMTSDAIPLNMNPNINRKTEDQPKAEEANKEQQEQFKKEQEDLEKLKQKLDEYITDNQLSAHLETTLNNEMLMITIRDNALFASGSATIKPEARLLAVAIANLLSGYPNYQIEVAGHTDNVPINSAAFDSNWDLSSARALNFMKILLNNNNIGPERFRSIGYGEYKPIDINLTPEGRSKNRRVEVSIMRGAKAPEMKELGR